VEVAGIIGALLAVPILAVTKAAIGSLLHDPELDPARVNPLRSARRLGGQPSASTRPPNPTGRD
jgi:hypothetical protein